MKNQMFSSSSEKRQASRLKQPTSKLINTLISMLRHDLESADFEDQVAEPASHTVEVMQELIKRTELNRCATYWGDITEEEETADDEKVGA